MLSNMVKLKHIFCLLLYHQCFRVLPQIPTGFLPLDSAGDIGPKTP